MAKYKKRITAAVLIFLLALGLCSGYLLLQRKNSTPHSLIYIPKTQDGTNDFWTSLISGTEMAASEYKASLEILAPTREQDVERQNELLREAIDKEPEAILISPSSFDASDELLKEAREKGIKLVFIDSYTQEELQDLTVATDNLEAGRKLGKYASTLLDKDSRIAIVSHVKGVSTAMEREQGFREGLGEYAGNVAEVVYCNSVFDKAYELAQELMEKYPDLEMIAGMNEYSAVGAARAVRDAGAQDRIKIVGVDSSMEAVSLMEQGIFRCLVVQKAFKMGYIGVRETLRLLNGEHVEKDIDSGCELVTPENMYDSEIEKLIFPFGSSRQEKS